MSRAFHTLLAGMNTLASVWVLFIVALVSGRRDRPRGVQCAAARRAGDRPLLDRRHGVAADGLHAAQRQSSAHHAAPRADAAARPARRADRELAGRHRPVRDDRLARLDRDGEELRDRRVRGRASGAHSGLADLGHSGRRRGADRAAVRARCRGAISPSGRARPNCPMPTTRARRYDGSRHRRRALGRGDLRPDHSRVSHRRRARGGELRRRLSHHRQIPRRREHPADHRL